MAKAKTEALALDPKALTPLELKAVEIVGKGAKNLRDRLTVGDDQAIDFTLRVQGSIQVAGNSSATVSENLEPVTVLALVLGLVSKRTRTSVMAQVTEACQAWVKGGDAPVPEEGALEHAQDLLGRASRKVTQPRRGNVTGRITAEVIRRPAAKVAA